ncbi:MAG TPA: hypothetical protein VFV38_10470 [Ktedonobacteraceae bacterium]|nr:hypothetical protein [Ktedonobacteraceae bacterium]
MLKLPRAGIAIVMGLMLSLTLFASGAMAQGVSSAQNDVSASPRASLTVAVPAGVQQGLQKTAAQPINQPQGKQRICGWWRGRFYPCRGYFRTVCNRNFRWVHVNGRWIRRAFYSCRRVRY